MRPNQRSLLCSPRGSGASAPARCVTVASHAHAMGAIDFDNLQRGRRHSGLTALTN